MNFINRIAVALLTVMFASASAFCQTSQSLQPVPAKYLIGAGIGINDFHMKDEYLSPLPFRGVIFSTRLLFEVKINNVKHESELFFSHGRPSPDNQAFDITQNIGLLSYSFLYNMDRWNIAGSSFNLFLGGGLSSFVMNSDLLTNSKTGEGYFIDQSWYWSHSLNILAEGEYILSENKTLSIKLQVPFFKVVTRPANGHWLGNTNQKVLNNFFNAAGGGKGEFIWKNFAVLYKMEYRQILNDRFALRASYDFNYAFSDTPLSMGMYMNNLLIGIDWLL